MSRRVRDQSLEVRELVEPAGGIDVELHAEGQRVSSARTRADALAGMQEAFGLKRADVRELLENALIEQFERKYQCVDLTPPALAPPNGNTSSGGRFFSRYVYRGSEDITAGMVWRDSSSSDTGPDHVPVIVRSKMRLAVNAKLIESRRGPLGFLVDILHGMAE